VVDPETVIATHLGQILNRHAADLLGPDEVQGLLDALGRAAPTLVQTVVPKLVPLHVLTGVMRQLLSDGLPVADLRRILEGLAHLSGQTLSLTQQAELLRPALVPLLLQQVIPLAQPVELATLAPDLEQILLQSRRQGEDGLNLEQGFAQRVLRSVGEAHDAAQARGRPLILVVTPALRRAFAAFLRPHVADAIVLGLSDLPDTRRIEITHSIGAQQAALPPADPAAPPRNSRS
jgi:flagellar biosynthesis protein FlhA